MPASVWSFVDSVPGTNSSVIINEHDWINEHKRLVFIYMYDVCMN